jgi:hypothetical protein
MMIGPNDAGGGDMGAMMMDAVDMMMPEGMDMPPEVGGAMMDMGGEAILQAPPADGACADMGTMMPPPGGYVTLQWILE